MNNMLHERLSLNKSRLLVCGGCGFMGSNFIHYTMKKYPLARIINLDALTYAGNPQNLAGIDKKKYTFVKGDICDTALMTRLMKKVDIVVNFAAETHVDRSIHGVADAFLHSNILGVHSLLKALKNSPNVKKMIHVSTDEVWGDLPLDSKRKFNENSPFLPNSPYAASKAAGDLLIRSYVKTYGLPVITTHSVNNFGPRQFPEKLIPFFTLRALHGKSLPLYGDGKNVRDWIYVGDHTRALLTILSKGSVGEVYGISVNQEYSNIAIADIILRMLKKPKALITFVTDRPAHDLRYAIDARKLRALGWRPLVSFKDGIRDTIEWYVRNKEWVKGVQNRASAIINPHIK